MPPEHIPIIQNKTYKINAKFPNERDRKHIIATELLSITINRDILHLSTITPQNGIEIITKKLAKIT
jgi:hypothetical protein